MPSKLFLLITIFVIINFILCSLFYLMNYCTDYFHWWNIKSINSWHELPPHSLHVMGPRHCQRVDKPHPASIASTRPAGARCYWKQVAQVVRNRSCVTDWYKRKFSQYILNRDDIKNTGFLWSSSYKSGIQSISTILP